MKSKSNQSRLIELVQASPLWSEQVVVTALKDVLEDWPEGEKKVTVKVWAATQEQIKQALEMVRQTMHIKRGKSLDQVERPADAFYALIWEAMGEIDLSCVADALMPSPKDLARMVQARRVRKIKQFVDATAPAQSARQE